MESRKQKIMKTLKSTKRCDALCKRYIKHLNRKFANRLEPYIPTKKASEENYQDCRRMYCNKPCNGALMNASPEEQVAFQKDIQHSFHKNYTRKQLTHLKKKGALSGCQSFDIMKLIGM
jgi:hypothetical protein